MIGDLEWLDVKPCVSKCRSAAPFVREPETIDLHSEIARPWSSVEKGFTH